ncbi:GGDEF domain-containing protein [Paenibacillus agricola]|uniref:GGDEF domain-containing protein n=1 Tax=Paenibacillus agricola TaxID=2716264 RepID=A0ABX0JGE5_9BACL|nr:GGDEF domain-containing protein [Paenibacillus agricola]NHN32906.1 GGDEF domain-containing protein [Paenibacillus agricola]
MNLLLLELGSKRHTYRKLLDLYWITIVLTLLLEFLLHHPQASPAPHLFYYSMVLQALGLSAITGIAEMLYRYRKIHNDDLLLVAGIIYASTIIYMNPTIGIVPAIYIFPILTSVLSFSKNRIFFAYFLVMACFMLLYMFSPELRISMQPLHIIGILFLYIGVTVISLTVTTSGIELLHNLNQATQTKQELLVQTIIMDKLSKMDALTKLYNHKTFHEYLEKLIEQNERNNLPLQLAIMDIDNFKKINDTYGHWVGDIILQRVAQAINESVTSNDFVARYGGEEFAVIFADKSLEQSYFISEQIREKLALTLHPELDLQAATLSIGLQDFSRGESKEALFKGADASLYLAKRSGKNQTAISA